MMPQTVPDGFEFEQFPGDEPGRTLHGGQHGNSPILAEQIQDKFVTTDAQLAGLTARVAALENGTGGVGAIPIGQGQGSGTSFTVDLTAGGKFPSPPLWSVIDMRMRVDLSDPGGLAMRFFGETANIYRSGSFQVDSTNTFDSDNWHLSGANHWRIAHLSTLSTGLVDLRLFHTAANPGLISFQCTSTRQSDDANVHRHTIAAGSLESGGVTATTLQFLPTAGASSIVQAYWWAWGMRMVAP